MKMNLYSLHTFVCGKGIPYPKYWGNMFFGEKLNWTKTAPKRFLEEAYKEDPNRMTKILGFNK